MSPTRMEKLTPEQEALIPVYREQWRANTLSTEPIDRQKASEAVKAAYKIIGREEPNIIFLDSPYAAMNTILSEQWNEDLSIYLNKLGDVLEYERAGGLNTRLLNALWHGLYWELDTALMCQLSRQLESRFRGNRRLNQLFYRLWDQLLLERWEHLERGGRGQLKREVEMQICNSIQTEDWASVGGFFDFCFSVLNYDCYEPRVWEVFQSLVKNCGWIFPLEKACVVCDRPIKLSFDSENRLHAEGSPAIQFADEYGLYSYHGVTLPEKYGSVHPQRWQAQWLLEEKNAELKRVLIQGIGYERICQELQARELDSWQEYTLLRIDDIDVEPIYLLKMTCPSTRFIHALRVPPDIQSAREAIRWVNWGVDPEEFIQQT